MKKKAGYEQSLKFNWLQFKDMIKVATYPAMYWDLGMVSIEHQITEAK